MESKKQCVVFVQISILQYFTEVIFRYQRKCSYELHATTYREKPLMIQEN